MNERIPTLIPGEAAVDDALEALHSEYEQNIESEEAERGNDAVFVAKALGNVIDKAPELAGEARQEAYDYVFEFVEARLELLRDGIRDPETSAEVLAEIFRIYPTLEAVHQYRTFSFLKDLIIESKDSVLETLKDPEYEYTHAEFATVLSVFELSESGMQSDEFYFASSAYKLFLSRRGAYIEALGALNERFQMVVNRDIRFEEHSILGMSYAGLVKSAGVLIEDGKEKFADPRKKRAKLHTHALLAAAGTFHRFHFGEMGYEAIDVSESIKTIAAEPQLALRVLLENTKVHSTTVDEAEVLEYALEMGLIDLDKDEMVHFLENFEDERGLYKALYTASILASSESYTFRVAGEEIFRNYLMDIYGYTPEEASNFYHRWAASYGETAYESMYDASASKGKYVLENIEKMDEIELKRKGSCALLTREFGIHNFARHDETLLLRQAETIDDVDTSWGALIYASTDHNGAFRYNTPGLERELRVQAKKAKKEFNFRVFEVDGSRNRVTRVLPKARRKYGLSDWTVFSAHGSPYGMSVSERDKTTIRRVNEDGEVTSDTSRIKLTDIEGLNLTNNPEALHRYTRLILLRSCSTAKETEDSRYIAKEVSRIFGVEVIGPDGDAKTSEFTLSWKPNEDSSMSEEERKKRPFVSAIKPKYEIFRDGQTFEVASILVEPEGKRTNQSDEFTQEGLERVQEIVG